MEVQFDCCPFGLIHLAGYLAHLMFDGGASGVKIIDVEVGTN